MINFTNNAGQTAQNVCEYAGIFGNQDGTVWASSPNFFLDKYPALIEKPDGSGTEQVTIDEFTNLLDAFQNNGICTMKGGVRIKKIKYFVFSYDSDRQVLYLKRSGGGATVAKSGQAFVIGTYSTTLKLRDFSGNTVAQNQGMTDVAVEALQQFLLENDL